MRHMAPALTAAFIGLTLVGCSDDGRRPVADSQSASETPGGDWAQREQDLCDARDEETVEAESDNAISDSEVEESEQEASPEAWSSWAVRTYQEFEGWDNSWQNDGRDGVDLSVSGPDVGFCIMTLRTMSMRANTVHLKFQTATDKTNEGYLGPVDSSQKVTVQAVESAALNAATYGALSDEHCSGDTKDSNCTIYRGMMRTYMKQPDAALISLQ